MENTTSQNTDLSLSDVKGHICLSFNGGGCCCAGGGTSGGTDNGNGSGGNVVQIDKALNFALLVPENTTWKGQEDTRIVVPAAQLPNPVPLKANLTMDSPFGNTPCITVAWTKNPHTGEWQTTTGNYYGDQKTEGVATNCPGDGKVYLSTGKLYVSFAPSNSYGLAAPIASSGTNYTSAEIVIGLWCATGDVLSDSAAFKALEARVAALEAGKA